MVPNGVRPQAQLSIPVIRSTPWLNHKDAIVSKDPPIELFMPPNMLKARVGGRFVGIDMAAIRRAETAVAELAPELADWISADITVLANAYLAFKDDPERRMRARLKDAAERLRVEAINFDFPLIVRVATSLCTLLKADLRETPATLVEAHVSAIRVISKQNNMRDSEDPLANVLAAELEGQVKQCIAKFAIAS